MTQITPAVEARGIVQGHQLFGVLGNGTAYQIALSISLVAAVAAMWILAVRL